MISFLDPEAAATGADLVNQVQAIFSPEGILSKASCFEYRPQQQRMAVAVAQALLRNENLAVEGGTGVGKSLAYLIPSILFAVANHKKAIISTYTINLQEQLIEKDLPMLAQILPVKFAFTMLKGRHNYVCKRRLARAFEQSGSLFTSPEAKELERIYEWSKTTTDGSLSDFEEEPDPRVWQQVCSERGLCSPKLCGHQSDFAKEHGVCFFQRVRSRILSADVVVFNHTLFFLHLAGLEEEVEGGVLFKNDFVVFDEAHQLEHVAAKHIGVGVSSGQVRYAVHRLWNPRTEKGLLATLRRGPDVALVDSLLSEADKFFAGVEEQCEALDAAARRAGNPASSSGKSGRAWNVVRVRRPDLVEDNLTLPIQRLRESVSNLIKLCEDKDTAQELLECNRRLLEIRNGVAMFLSQDAEENVYWVERAGKLQRTITLNAAPVDVAEYLRRRLFSSDTSVIMTSATLAVAEADRAPAKPAAIQQGNERGEPEVGRRASAGPGGATGLEYFVKRVGAENATRLQVGSPFDYQEQMKLYVVNKMPDPREREYRDQLAHWIEHFIKMTHGKAFVLFTNFKLMQEVARMLEPFFDRLGLQCFVQGAGTPRSLMLQKFKEDRDSVLFGTDSFWQGVDVPGEALSNVIITRLPFAVPDHPLIEARIENIEGRGGNAFMEFSLPEAILKFRQGVGRLIRSKTDKGIVVVLDNRLLTKRYGQAFIDALPKCPVEIV